MEGGMSHEEALDWLIKLGIVPTWDSLAKRVIFKSAVKRGWGYKVIRQFKEKTWPLLIEALTLHNYEATKQIRDEVKSGLRGQGRM